MTLGRIHSFETFGSVDGPGVRFVVFMQGCRMRCKYCHNPDSWKINAGDEMSAKEVLDKALRYRRYWGDKGGITASGGEPLLQMDFLIELFKLCKKEGIHTTIDTAGAPFTFEEPFISKFNELMEYTDLIMLDIKHIDPQKHYELTKVHSENIIEMAKYLDKLQKAVWIRHVLVPGYTDDDLYLHKTYEFIKSLSNVKRVEVLPYHSFGMYKWESMGLPYELTDTPTPSEERIKNANDILQVSTFVDYKK